MIRVVGVAVVSLAFLGFVAERGLSQNPLIGPKAGFNVSRIVGDDAESFWGLDQSHTGFSIGAFITYKFTPNFSIQPEGYYTQLGGKGGDDTDGGSIRIHYVEAPILAKFTLPNQSYVTPYLIAGPSVVFRVGCNLERHEGGTTREGGCEDWIAETPIGNVPIEIKTTTIGLVLGLGFDVEVWGGAFGLDVRYRWGLSSMDETTLATDIKNRSFHILLGYGFAWQI
jgi:opacity protein-like surface antigen